MEEKKKRTMILRRFFLEGDEKKEEGRRRTKRRRRNSCTRDGRDGTNQPKVVQEVLADLKTSWSFISKGLKSPAPFQCDSAIMVLEAPRRLVPNGLLREMLIGG